MNKVAINLLCILILTVLGATIIIPGGGLGYYFLIGFEKGLNSEESVSEQTENPFENISVEAVPSSLIDTPRALHDSIRFDDGRIYPVTFSSMKIHTGEKEPLPLQLHLVSGLAAVAIIVIYILMAVKFVKFVIHINKGEIFSNRNIRLLTWIGIFLLAIALLQTLIGVLDDISLSSLNLSLEGNTLTAHWGIPFSDFILGLMGLLMANIWRRGLQLKEEQELTI